MSSIQTPPPLNCDVAIIGSGPSGLAIATELKKLGVASVVILEREPQAGGIPRHCGHPPFGMREFRRVYTGPRYARRLVDRARRVGVMLCLNTTVSSIEAGGILQLSSLKGCHTLRASRIVICTGIRETPRAPRFISGQRPLGIMTTGALQSIVYLQNKAPFKRPVIIGSELVSFSTLLTCRHAGIRPVAMLEQNSRITARTGSQLFPKILGVPLLLNTRLIEILGKQKVLEVRIVTNSEKMHSINCDGVIFTGQFVAESSLIRMSHLQIDPQTGNPIIDQFNRCSDPDYFAIGNMTHPVETAGFCWSDGMRTAPLVYASLSGLLDRNDRRINIVSNNPKIKYIVPQVLSLPTAKLSLRGMPSIQLRLNTQADGQLSFNAGTSEWTSKYVRARPEQRIELPIPELTHNTTADSLNIRFEEN